MIKTHAFQNHCFYLFILLATCTAIFFSCRKIDTSHYNQLPIDYTEKFFTFPANVNPAVVKVINKLKEKNAIHPFVNDFVNKNGFPKWEFADVVPRKKKSNYLQRGMSEDSLANTIDTIVMIPVANEVAEKIKSILAADVKDNEMTFHLLRDYMYKQFGYEPKTDGSYSAKEITAMFLGYEYKVYQKKLFHITDVKLAKEILGDAWEDKLTTLIAKEDPVTEKLGFWKATVTIGISLPADYNTIVNYPYGTTFNLATVVPVGTLAPVIVHGYYFTNPFDDPNWDQWLNTPGDSDGPGPGSGNGGGSNGSGPYGGGGGGGGGSGSGGGGSGYPSTDPGWQTPMCNGERLANGSLVVVPCDTVNHTVDSIPLDSIIRMKLHKDNISIIRKRNQMWDSAYLHNWEYFGFIIEEAGQIKIIGDTTTKEENQVDIKKKIVRNKIVVGDYHTHQDSLPGQRHLQDPGDIFYGNGDWLKNLYFRSYVDCGDTLYALVTENLDLVKDFIKRHNLLALQESGAWVDSLYTAQPVRRRIGRRLLLELIGNSSSSGLGLYYSVDADKTYFIKAN